MSVENPRLIGWHRGFAQAEDPQKYRCLIAEKISQGWDVAARQAASKRMTKQWESADFRKQMGTSASDSNRTRKCQETTREKQSERFGGIRNKCWPLLLRGAEVEDVLQIRTEFTRSQIENLIRYQREKDFLEKPTKEKTRERMGKERRNKPRWTKGRLYTQEQQNAFRLARLVCEGGFITRDLTFWNKLVEIYEMKQRKMPDFFADRLRLEVFLLAMEQAMSGNKKNLERYEGIVTVNGKERKFDNFTEEEKFVFACLNKISYSLEGRVEKYPPFIKRRFRIVDENKEANSWPLELKLAVGTYLVMCGTGENPKKTAERLGISEDEATRQMRLVAQELTDEQWDLLEQMVNELSNPKPKMTGVIYDGAAGVPRPVKD